MQSFVSIGHVHTFLTEGTYLIKLEATDYNGFIGFAEQEITIDNIIEIKQSLSNPYMPYRGMHITSSIEPDSSYENKKEWFEENDKDQRPQLGIFYYDEDNFTEMEVSAVEHGDFQDVFDSEIRVKSDQEDIGDSLMENRKIIKKILNEYRRQI